MRFPYTRYTVQGTAQNSFAPSFRPMIIVRVIGPIGADDILGRVDSGADDTLLPDYLIPALGVANLSMSIPIGGIGGAVFASYGTVDLEIVQGQASFRWAPTSASPPPALPSSASRDSCNSSRPPSMAGGVTSS